MTVPLKIGMDDCLHVVVPILTNPKVLQEGAELAVYKPVKESERLLPTKRKADEDGKGKGKGKRGKSKRGKH